MTPGQLEELRNGLPVFGKGAPDAKLLAAYCSYYSLDFDQCIPGVTYRLGTITSGDYQLATHHWQCEGATTNLLLMHGYFDHTGIFGKLVSWALSRKCNVLMFDLPGHGLSSGEHAAIDDFGDYARAIHDVLGTVPRNDLPLWTMGQSTGGAALIEFARRYDWPFSATVLLAPLIRPAGWPVIRLAHPVVRLFRDHIPRDFAVNSSDEAFLAFLKQEPLQSRQTSLRWVGALRRWLSRLAFEDLGVGPALVVQGDKDGTVDWRYNVPRLEKLFPDSTVEYVVGAGHQLANESEALRTGYLATVRGYLVSNGLPLFEGQDQDLG